MFTREGPILGAAANFYMPQQNRTISIGEKSDRYVRCFDGWSGSDFDDVDIDLTRCVRMGAGWNSTNANATFYIDGDELTPFVEVCAYFSDQAIYLPTQNIEQAGCYNGTDCEWENLANMKINNTDFDAFSKNLLVIEISSQKNKTIFEFVTFLTFASYTLDASPNANPLYFINTDGLFNSNNLSSIVVHPDWFLAAWSVNENDSLPSNRSAGSAVVRGLRDVDESLALGEMQLLIYQSYF